MRIFDAVTLYFVQLFLNNYFKRRSLEDLDDFRLIGNDDLTNVLDSKGQWKIGSRYDSYRLFAHTSFPSLIPEFKSSQPINTHHRHRKAWLESNAFLAHP